MQHLIGVDIGTQGTKAALFDESMNLVCDAFEPSKLICPAPGTVWQEADDLYGACVRTIRTLMDKSGIDPHSVAAIGLDGQMAGIMGIDRNGEAATYYDSWLDTRSGRYVSLLRDAMGDEAVTSSGGQLSINHSTKILWWKREHPDVYQRIAKFVLPHGYVAGKMTGLKAEESVFDHTCLHFSSFSDNVNKSWNETLLGLFDVSLEKMPRIVSPFDVIGATTEGFSKASGLVAGIPVVAGAGDTAAGTFGSGLFSPNMVLDCAGTASILSCVVDRFVPDVKHQTLIMMRSPVEELWLPLTYINGGGLCLRWFRDLFRGDPNVSYDTLAQEAALVPPGSEGLLFCPHLCGRVLPSDPKLKGAMLGLDHEHTRGHLFRSILEGIAYEYAYYLKVMRENFPDRTFSRITSIGGGSKSALFHKIKADVLGIPVSTFETGETALLGSAVIAGYGVRLLRDYQEPILRANRHKDDFIPQSENHALYAKKSAAYLAMLHSLSVYYNQA